MPRLHRCVLGLLLCLSVSQTARSDLVEDAGVWGYVIAQGNFGMLNPQWQWFLWYMEGTGRYREGGKELNQSILRPALGYALSDKWSLWLGYAWNAFYPKVGESIDENRIWQQILWSDQTALGKLTSRSRLEQRFLETAGDEVAWRFRQMFKLSQPIWGKLGLVGWDEVFVGLNDPDGNKTLGATKGFDQNRAFAGFGYDFDKQIRVEVGYLNQFISTAPDDKLNHIAVFSLYLNF
jgi:uncharacterized protein DUF2490